MNVRIKRLQHALDLPIPSYATDGAAGIDLYAASLGCAIGSDAAAILDPRERIGIGCGVAVEIPPGHEGQVRGRSGLAKRGLSIVHGVGTIDSDYRGEIVAMLVNHGDRPVEINRGDRIAQLVIAPVVRATLAEVDELTETERGAGGFGSTGR